ncbi:hypothetical protein HPB52_011929 [Rhipicephalus sanguineus]|uniref:Uncharacterized protein n=1 Tax=Rhipicephalus sanguineus TaxID=34632 RepID=A0A9D4PZL2_RHISA|nr:hypothetical protein HPB52_011929 [Rhipicephalus sanguineus]
MPGVKEVRVNTRNTVAADAVSGVDGTPTGHIGDYRDMSVIARLPADRSQSSGVVQGVHGNCANDDLLANASSEQRGHQASAEKRGGAKPTFQKKALQSASNEENKNLRLFLRVVADVLPPDNQQPASSRILSLPPPELPQWNANSLRRQQTDLSLHLMTMTCLLCRKFMWQQLTGAFSDMLASSRTSCTWEACQSAPCLDEGHEQGAPHAEVHVTDLLSGPVECCAVGVRLGSSDNRSQYICPSEQTTEPSQPHLTRPTPRQRFPPVRFNAHHTAWGSRRCCPRSQRLWDVYNQLGLSILNTGTPTFVRRAVRAVLHHRHHLPLLINPIIGMTARSKVCHSVGWKKDADSGTFVQLVAEGARMATVRSTAQVGQPVPDIQHLELRAARRHAERVALRTTLPENWSAFRRVDAVCRRHARRRRNQSWLGVCCSFSRSP